MSGKRSGVGIAAAVGASVTAMAVIVVLLGAWKWFVRATAPTLLGWPGAPWAVGGILGLLTAVGGAGGIHLTTRSSGGSDMRRVGQGLGFAACAVAAFAPLMYVLSALPGKNCRSSQASCDYISGTGSVLLAYVVSAAGVGLLLYRWIRARAEEEQVRERERLRRLRKKGKGKSRGAVTGRR